MRRWAGFGSLAGTAAPGGVVSSSRLSPDYYPSFSIPIFPMSSIGKLMKQAARIQKQLEVKQAELAARTVEATSGGGVVKVVAKCDGTIGSIKIDPQAVNPSDVTLLEDLVLTAANNALTQAKQIQNDEMGTVAGGLNLPGLMG